MEWRLELLQRLITMTIFLITITSLLIGYILGIINGVNVKEKVEEKYQEYKRELKKKSSPVGAVMAPDAKRLEQLENPKKAEEEQEMSKLFEEILK